MNDSRSFLDAIKGRKFASPRDARTQLNAMRAMLSLEEHLTASTILSAWELENAIESSETHFLFDLVPEGWLRDYLSYASIGESPLIFHLMTACALLGHKVGRRVYRFLHGNVIWPTLNVFLVSPAGLAGRGETIAVMNRIAQRSNASIVADAITPEGLVDALIENPHRLLVAEEAAQVLNRREYMATMTQLLCQVLDCTDFGVTRRTKGGGISKTDPITANAIFSSSPKMFEGMPSHALGGGMWSRFIFVFEHFKERTIPFPDDLLTMKQRNEREQALAESLLETVKVFGNPREPTKLKYSGRAKQEYDAWYRDNDRATRAATDEMSSWYSRKRVHVNKLMMLLLASSRCKPVVMSWTLETTLAIISHIEEKQVFAYAHASSNPEEKKRQVVLDSLMRSKGGEMRHSDMWRRVRGAFLNNADFERVITGLEEDGTIERRRVKPKLGGRTLTIYELRT